MGRFTDWWRLHRSPFLRIPWKLGNYIVAGGGARSQYGTQKHVWCERAAYSGVRRLACPSLLLCEDKRTGYKQYWQARKHTTTLGMLFEIRVCPLLHIGYGTGFGDPRYDWTHSASLGYQECRRSKINSTCPLFATEGSKERFCEPSRLDLHRDDKRRRWRSPSIGTGKYSEGACLLRTLHGWESASDSSPTES